MKLTTAALAPYHALAPRSQGFGPTIIGTPGHGKLLALTYDDGPNKRWTPALLEILARHGLKATFFVVGKYVEERPDLVQRAVAEGHEIGNHTYSHANLLFLSEAQIGEELDRCAEAVDRAGLAFSEVPAGRLCRPPYGRRRPGTLRALQAHGYVPVLWSVTCWDWSKRVTTDKIDRHARKQVRGGDVILLHDGDGDHGMDVDRHCSLEATERVIERYGEAGFEFVTIPELVARSSKNGGAG